MPMTAFRLVPEAKLRDWAWRLERDMRRGHQCDVARNAESVMQSIAAVIAAAPAPVVSDAVREAVIRGDEESQIEGGNFFVMMKDDWQTIRAFLREQGVE